MSSDVERLRRDFLISDVAFGYGVELSRDGAEWVACCPFHAEDTPSFTIFAGDDLVQRYHCFGCGAKGDVLDFVRGIKGVDLKEAIKILGGGKSGPNIAPAAIKVRNIYADIKPVDPHGEINVGDWVKLYNPKRAGHEWEWGKFKAEMVFPYRRADGSLLGYVLRRNLPGGNKETPMVMWVQLPSGEECWSRFPFPKPRLLYGLHELREGQVIVVEGEKCRDAMAAASKRCVVSWSGGTQGVKHTDWSPLAGRPVVIWPDADSPGLGTANDIAARLDALGCSVKVLDISGSVAA